MVGEKVQVNALKENEILKNVRKGLGFSQVEMAEKLDVSRSRYQRMESGEVQISPDLFDKITDMMNLTEVFANVVIDEEDVDGNVFGEVVIHFKSDNEPIIFKISEQTCGEIEEDLCEENSFLIFSSLSNQTVVVNRESVSDIYLSPEDSDVYGPEEDRYEYHEFMEKDPKVWEAAEKIYTYGELYFFDENLTDSEMGELEKYVYETYLSEEDVMEQLIKNNISKKEINKIMGEIVEEKMKFIDLVVNMRYRLKNGQERVIPARSVVDLSIMIEEIYDDYSERDFIFMHGDEGRKPICINKKALEYISIPSHMLIEDDEEIDEEKK